MKWANKKPSWVRWAETDDGPDDDVVVEREFADPMKTDDAAAYLGINQSTVNRLVNRGELTAAVNPSGRGKWRWFSKADLDRYKQK